MVRTQQLRRGWLGAAAVAIALVFAGWAISLAGGGGGGKPGGVGNSNNKTRSGQQRPPLPPKNGLDGKPVTPSSGFYKPSGPTLGQSAIGVFRPAPPGRLVPGTTRSAPQGNVTRIGASVAPPPVNIKYPEGKSAIFQAIPAGLTRRPESSASGNVSPASKYGAVGKAAIFQKVPEFTNSNNGVGVQVRFGNNTSVAARGAPNANPSAKTPEQLQSRAYRVQKLPPLRPIQYSKLPNMSGLKGREARLAAMNDLKFYNPIAK